MRYSARISNSFAGEWELYVVTGGPSLEWPEHFFERTGPVPTVQERADALARLGYTVVDGAVWQWQELTDDATARVALLAALDVRPIGGGQ
ncbi:DUF6303 family protein [Streptomyces sp. TP-A0875]|uniref:DUF6303 family protein n=1 Tax=Streptomyces sp. TP-A0875 TaxID=552354 RepID=UPI0006B5B36C|nr:DUF6303 family protein [Streptomyces sp. TP-A0875]